MDEGVPVSHHNCTTLDLSSSHSCFFPSICLSITLSLSLSLCSSPHPCSREINPRSPTSVEREQSLSLANCGSSCRVDSGGRPARRTLPHHSPTGHWAPQPQLPLNNCRLSASRKWLLLLLHINFVNAKTFTRQCLPTCFLSQNVSFSCCVLSGDQTRKAQFNQ